MGGWMPSDFKVVFFRHEKVRSFPVLVPILSLVSNLVLEDIILDCPAGQWSSEESRSGMQGRLQWVELSFPTPLNYVILD